MLNKNPAKAIDTNESTTKNRLAVADPGSKPPAQKVNPA